MHSTIFFLTQTVGLAQGECNLRIHWFVSRFSIFYFTFEYKCFEIEQQGFRTCLLYHNLTLSMFPTSLSSFAKALHSEIETCFILFSAVLRIVG